MLDLIARAEALFQPDSVSIRISLKDSRGHLRQIAAAGPHNGLGRPRYEHRRSVLTSGSARRFELRSLPGHVAAVIPLNDRGTTPVGVMEVVASAEAMTARWKALLEQPWQIGSSADPPAPQIRELLLARDLIRAGSPEQVVRTVVRYCYESQPRPIASWLSAEGAHELRLVTALGLARTSEGRLRRELNVIPRWSPRRTSAREAVLETFSKVVSSEDLEVLHAGPVVILAAGGSRESRLRFRSIRGVLLDALKYLSVLRAVEERSRSVDLGLAWTAHEIRNPLLAARASLESLIMLERQENGNNLLLRRSHDELSKLTELTDSLLEWSMGAASLKQDHLDLSLLLRQAAASCGLEGSDRRITIVAPRTVAVSGDEQHLRAALSNVVRNALLYSPPGSPVKVRLSVSRGYATVSVEDHGPGISSDETEAIFSPFVRGKAGRSVPGRGLGLFVARQVIKAHGGRIWAFSNRQRTTFRIELPTCDEGRLKSARAS